MEKTKLKKTMLILAASAALLIAYVKIKNFFAHQTDGRKTYVTCQTTAIAKYLKFVILRDGKIPQTIHSDKDLLAAMTSRCKIPVEIINGKLTNPYKIPYEAHIGHDSILICTDRERRFFEQDEYGGIEMACKVWIDGTIEWGDECVSDEKNNIRIKNVTYKLENGILKKTDDQTSSIINDSN
jgi:hypothetical protein